MSLSKLLLPLRSFLGCIGGGAGPTSGGDVEQEEAEFELMRINLTWVNAPEENRELTLETKPSTTLTKFQKIVLKQILLQVDLQFTSVTKKLNKEPRSEFTLMTKDGFFLSERADYLTLQDLDFDGNGTLKFFIQTKNFGSLMIFPVQGFGLKLKSKPIKFDLATDTLEILRSRISELTSIPNSSLLISGFNNEPLQKKDKNTLLRDVFQPFSKVTFYSASEGGTIQLNVKTLIGNSISFILPKFGSTILDLMKSIQMKLETPIEDQRLIFTGRQLEPERTLSCYNIQNEATVHLVLRLRGGGGPGTRPPPHIGRGENVKIAFADVSNPKNLVQHNFSSSGAPEWRRVAVGLNIEGICGNSKCVAYGKQIAVPFRNANFHLNYDCDEVCCPICWKKLKSVLTCGFVDTFWRYFGRKTNNPGELLCCDWRETGYNYTTFNVNSKGGGLKGMEDWSYLVIQTRKKFIEGPQRKYPLPTRCGVCFKNISHNEFGSQGQLRLQCGHIYHKECGMVLKCILCC